MNAESAIGILAVDQVASRREADRRIGRARHRNRATGGLKKRPDAKGTIQHEIFFVWPCAALVAQRAGVSPAVTGINDDFFPGKLGECR